MKKLILTLMIVPYICVAQSSLKINYNEVYVGNNISIDFDYNLDNILLSFGVVYFPGINKDNVSFSAFYKDRGSPTSFKQHFGFQYNIGYMIYNNDHFDLFGVYKGSLSSMDTYFKFFQNYAALVPEPQGIEDYAVTINTDKFGPLFSFDNTLGILLKGNLTNNLFFNLHGGVGFTYLKNNDDFTITSASYGTISLSTTFSIGLGYSFNNLKSNNKE
ncbi:MAG: hypothetical protein WEA99_06780 [Brumimicrobium sp.]